MTQNPYYSVSAQAFFLDLDWQMVYKAPNMELCVGHASAILSCKKWLLRRSSFLYLSPLYGKKRLPN